MIRSKEFIPAIQVIFDLLDKIISNIILNQMLLAKILWQVVDPSILGKSKEELDKKGMEIANLINRVSDNIEEIGETITKRKSSFDLFIEIYKKASK